MLGIQFRLHLSGVILMFEICLKRIAVIVNFVTLFSGHRDKNREKTVQEKWLKKRSSL